MTTYGFPKFADFAKEYQGKKLENNNYFGFDFHTDPSERGFYHIHCRTFLLRNEDEVWLYDFGKHVIMVAKMNSVTGVTSCKSNYWDVNCQLYLKDY